MSRTAWARALDVLYPPLCAACGAEVEGEAALCPACYREAWFIAGPACARCGLPTAAAVCDGCRAEPPVWARGACAALYQGPVRKAVLALKHGDRLEVAQAAAVWMLRVGRPLLAEADLVAPAPLHWTRLARRRFNQAGELARALTARAGQPGKAALDLLRRTRRTPSQDGRTRAGRRANVAGAFAVSRRWRGRLAGRRVLLVDDVMTTGATLSACARTLYDAGAAQVDVLALARVAREAEATDWEGHCR